MELGKIITTREKKDAIHIAIIPLKATEKIWPGEKVSLVNQNSFKRNSIDSIGIVDPFLDQPVFPGQTCWIFLFPNSITSLRHDWTHPAFKDMTEDNNTITELKKSINFIKEFSKKAGISYEEMLEAANKYIIDGEYLCDGGRWESFFVPEEFWDHYEIVVGTKVKDSDRGTFFSCTC